MKTNHRLEASHQGGEWLWRATTAAFALLVLGLGARADDPNSAGGSSGRNGDAAGETSDSPFAPGGDETVGTLPSVADPGRGGRTWEWLSQYCEGFVIEGPALDLFTTLVDVQGVGRVVVDRIDPDADIYRMTLRGNFRVVFSHDLLAASRLKTGLWTERSFGGGQAEITWMRRARTATLPVQGTFDVPLAAMARSHQLDASRLSIHTVNGLGIESQLSARVEQGLLIVTLRH